MSNELKFKWGQMVRRYGVSDPYIIMEVDVNDLLQPYRATRECGGHVWCSEDELSPWEPEQVEAQQQPIAQDSGWIEWNGGEQPVASSVEVETVYRNGRKDRCLASEYWWCHKDSPYDIIRYRTVNQEQTTVKQPLVEEQPTAEAQKENTKMKRKQDVAIGDRVVYTGNDYEGKYRGKEGVVVNISQDCEVDIGPNWIDILVEGVGEPCALPAQWEYVEHQQPAQAEPPSMIVSPKHYVLFPEQGIEVRHVNKAWMDKIDNEGEYVSHHEAAWLVQATQYIFRSPFKGSTIEDLNKAIQSLQYVVESMNARKAAK